MTTTSGSGHSAKSIERANAQLAADGVEVLPEGLTPHSLRRTFASLLFAIGEPPPYVMAQMGHTTASLTLSIYARQMDRRDGESERLKALVEGRGSRESHLRSARPYKAICPTLDSEVLSVLAGTSRPLTGRESHA
jgi:hypothetical protein